MTPHEFIRKWKPVALTERASAQEHFLDLCRLFEHPTPAEADPAGTHFAFEKGAQKTGGGDGFADVWKKGFFAWEYKKKKRDLGQALEQLTRYAAALENPPLHVVCDTVRFRIETRWTNTIVESHEFELEDLDAPHNLKLLHAVFHDPELLRPKATRESITREAADKFQSISDALQHRHPDREAVAHFVNQLVFCFFADSVKLLPAGLLRKLLQTSLRRPKRSKDYFDKLFAEMERGGEFDLTEIAHFNGGLFDGRRALELAEVEIGLLFAASSLNWALIDPTIFGTLFERFLDPDKRAQIGAHYTDAAKIMMIVEPVVMRPLRAEWERARDAIKAALDKPGKPGVALAQAEVLRDAFIARLGSLRILDPACGSGNFLYLALQSVKDLEYRAILECESFGLQWCLPRVGPEILLGLEINPFAAELARTTVWIGDIQWRIRNAITHHPEPILRKLDTIECRDALLNADGSEAHWPEADFIVGNPPFLGGKKLRNGLGDAAVDALFAAYKDRVPAQADLVTYWLVKSWEAMRLGRVQRAGLVSTNSIRGGANRKALEPIADANAIFEAWADESWTVDGAAVRVSIVCFALPSAPHAEEARSAVSKHKRATTGAPASFETHPADAPQDEGVANAVLTALLNGQPVARINPDLSGAANFASASPLVDNADVCFQGPVKVGAFDISGELARAWLAEPVNPNGKSNSEVLRPWVNGSDLVRRPSNKWIIDFEDMSEAQAALFQSPFGYCEENIKPERLTNARERRRRLWWRHGDRVPAMLSAIGNKKRYIATPRVAKHRVFVWVQMPTVPDARVVAIARDDDCSFGLLTSKWHEAWSLATCSWHGDGDDGGRPTYNTGSCFETFPFPHGLTPNISAADYAADPRAQRIAAAAKDLDNKRRLWLNPPDLVDIVPEVVPGYPDRILPKNAEAAVKLRERTLTNLYNQRPAWLANAHEALDRAVAAAYGWPEDIAIDDALAKLLALNLERASLSPRAGRGSG